jgi:hypothetical protein
MKVMSSWRITVTSSLNEISKDHHTTLKGGGEGEGVTPPTPPPLYSRLLDRYLKTT